MHAKKVVDRLRTVATWDRLRSTIPTAAADLVGEIADEHPLSHDDAALLSRIAADVTSRC